MVEQSAPQPLRWYPLVSQSGAHSACKRHARAREASSHFRHFRERVVNPQEAGAIWYSEQMGHAVSVWVLSSFRSGRVFRGTIMARTCIFCGAPANSREDVWPCWLTSRFTAPGTMEAERGPELQMTTWQVDRPELVVKRVCRQCNNGWMSQLQGRGKPVIERLWNQDAVTLDLEDCQALSLWAVMTSMVLQTLGDEENWLYSDYERTLMWNSQRMPSFIGIWIANCIGHTETYSQSRSMWSGPSRDAQRQARGNAITMAFRQACHSGSKSSPGR